MRLIRGDLAMINISMMSILHVHASRGDRLTLSELAEELHIDPVVVESILIALLRAKQDNDFYDCFLWVLYDPENEHKGEVYPPLSLLRWLFTLPDLTMDYIGDWAYHTARAADERKEWFVEEEKILIELEGYLKHEE